NYYGPFQSGLTVNRLLKDIKEEFKLRKCDDKNLKASPNHSTCMYHEIGKCKAPCNLSQSKQDYQEEVIKVHNFLTSLGKNSAQNLYQIMMNDFSEKMDYE